MRERAFEPRRAGVHERRTGTRRAEGARSAHAPATSRSRMMCGEKRMMRAWTAVTAETDMASAKAAPTSHELVGARAAKRRTR